DAPGVPPPRPPPDRLDRRLPRRHRAPAGDGAGGAGRGSGAAPRRPAGAARGHGSGAGGSRPDRDAGDHALAVAALLRLLPGQRAARGRPGRLGQHRPRRGRPVLAIRPGGDGGGRGRHRLDAPDGGPVGRLERGDPGHRLHQHANRFDLRAGTGDGARHGARRAASRAAAAGGVRLRAEPQLRGQSGAAGGVRAGVHPARAVRRRLRDARRRAGGDGAGGPRAGRPPLRLGRHHRHHRHHGARPGGRGRGGRAASRALDARGCRHGRQRDDPAGMPLDVGRGRGRGQLGAERAQVARRAVRLLALLRARPGALGAGDVHQPELPAKLRGRAGEESPRLGHPARAAVPGAEAVVHDPRAGRRGAAGAAAARHAERALAGGAGGGGAGLARAGAGPVADRVPPPRTAEHGRRGAGPAHARLGGAVEPLRRGVSHPGRAGRALDGAGFRGCGNDGAGRRRGALGRDARSRRNGEV
ncbi:MAG: Aromatic-L-amino-acid decarboxylase, partial [uncultured Acetobacteraceae bacterium]